MTANYRHLPVAQNGFQVPWFVRQKPDEPLDFRVVDREKFYDAVKKDLCWTCGEHRGRYAAFVIGPMCAVSRVTSEPGNHLACAEFAVTNCPFLSNPAMRRSPRALPEEAIDAAGHPILRNPGVSCIWITRSWTLFKPHTGNEGVLFQLGHPERVEWWHRGRHATREEVEASLRTGLPELERMAATEGAAGIAELARLVERVEPLLPRA